MKIIEEIVARELDVSRSVVLWNLLDFEHLRVVHGGYTDVELVFENEQVTLEYVTFRVPVFSFLRSRSLHFTVRDLPNSVTAWNIGLFKIPSTTHIAVEEINLDRCRITTTYRFLLKGWTKVLAPFMPWLIRHWNEKVWQEDLPLKLRRQKVLRHGFVDFSGLPEKIIDRKREGELPYPRGIAPTIFKPTSRGDMRKLFAGW